MYSYGCLQILRKEIKQKPARSNIPSILYIAPSKKKQKQLNCFSKNMFLPVNQFFDIFNSTLEQPNKTFFFNHRAKEFLPEHFDSLKLRPKKMYEILRIR